MEHVIPQGSMLHPLLFLLYTVDLPKIINNKSKTTLFADDTSVIVTNPNSTDFKNDTSTVLYGLKSISNFHILVQHIKFTTKNNYCVDINLNYNNKQTVHVLIQNFLEQLLRIHCTQNSIQSKLYSNYVQLALWLDLLSHIFLPL
jgi:hypothetical protein